MNTIVTLTKRPRHADWAHGRKLWDRGVSQVQIARALGVTQQRVSAKAKQAGWPPRRLS